MSEDSLSPSLGVVSHSLIFQPSSEGGHFLKAPTLLVWLPWALCNPGDAQGVLPSLHGYWRHFPPVCACFELVLGPYSPLRAAFARLFVGAVPRCPGNSGIVRRFGPSSSKIDTTRSCALFLSTARPSLKRTNGVRMQVGCSFSQNNGTFHLTVPPSISSLF